MYRTCNHLIEILIIAKVTYAQYYGASCTTPNFESSFCIPIRSCKVLFDALKNADEEIIAFAQQSQCGYAKEPLVCCGSSARQITVCGMEKDSERIFGGTITNPEEFPWMVALEYTFRHNGTNAGIKCAGSLISEKFVVTAAHCIISDLLELQRAWLGDWKLSTNPDCETLVVLTECADPVVKVSVIRSITHPDFSASLGTNDIGLLRLARNVVYTDYIRPICLPSEDLSDLDQPRSVAGWGITDNGQSSDVKLKAEVPLVDNAQCSKKLRIPIHSNQMCAGGKQGKDACRGDSGGPLMRSYIFGNSDSKYQWYLEGIVSWGIDCGRIGYPAIYTRVFKYLSWIRGVINTT